MHPEVKEFLPSYPPEVQAIARKLRAMVLRVVPEALEQVDKPAKMLAYGRSATYKGMVAVIMPQKTWVNLGLPRGATLPDPAGLLEGTGKRARHVKVRSLEAAEALALRALVEASAKDA
jgi:hypothetical protein